VTDITQLPSFVNWRDGTYDKYHFDITINEHELTADWKETFMIDEVPKDDAWEVFSTEKKIALEDLYLDNGVTKECTRHYMDITPRLHGDLKRFADKFAHTKHHCTLLKLTPGCCLMWHYDSFSAFVKFQNINQADYGKIKRAAIMITDWNFGQTIQLGNDVIGHWKKGDVYTWQGDMWHGAGNFGLSNLVCFQITYLDV
jgi:hypothetical protein